MTVGEPGLAPRRAVVRALLGGDRGRSARIPSSRTASATWVGGARRGPGPSPPRPPGEGASRPLAFRERRGTNRRRWAPRGLRPYKGGGGVVEPAQNPR